jgi:hypothetical protein
MTFKRVVFAVVGVVAMVACTQDAPTIPLGQLEARSVLAAPDNGKPLVLRLFGTGEGRGKTASDPSAVPAGATCFDVDLFDATTNRQVGTATDCLSEVDIIGTDPSGNPILRLRGTTVFDFGRGNRFVTQGLTTVQPTTHGSTPVTHITGAIPDPGANGVIGGEGRFAGFDAEARLSGAVNLSRLGDGFITFDCVFVINPL